jgi:transcriptional regulator with XRE-family HTH domain
MKLNLKKFEIVIARNCMSIKKLSKKSGVQEATISKIKNNKQKASIVTIGKLAKALDVDVLEIVDQEN